MFKNLFSLKGRIRRTEFVLSFIIYFFGMVVIGNIVKNTDEGLWVVFYLVLLFFLITQSAKRCHDMNNSGWFILVPFYVLWMIFKEGTPGDNSYGSDPKEKIFVPVKVYSTNELTVPVERPAQVIAGKVAVTGIVESIRQSKVENTPANGQSLLEISNCNYTIVQDILKRLRAMNDVLSLSYTISGTIGTVLIHHINTTQSLLDDLYTTSENIEVRQVQTGNISINIKKI